MANTIQKKATELATKKDQKTLADYIKVYEGAIAQALPSVLTVERFSRMATTALSTTPKLKECTPASFIGAFLTAAQLGLEPNTPLGQAYLIPYKNKRQINGEWVAVDEVQFQIGYKGLIDLAYRSGEIELVQAQIVYANDTFECEYGLEPKLKHIPATSNRGEMVKVYALFKTKSGGYGFEVMSVEDIKKHAAKFSKSADSKYSPWTTNFEEMAKKTVLKKVLKYAPMKSDFVKGVVQDSTIKTEMAEDMYLSPDETIIEADYTEVTEDAEKESN